MHMRMRVCTHAGGAPPPRESVCPCPCPCPCPRTGQRDAERARLVLDAGELLVRLRREHLVLVAHRRRVGLGHQRRLLRLLLHRELLEADRDGALLRLELEQLLEPPKVHLRRRARAPPCAAVGGRRRRARTGAWRARVRARARAPTHTTCDLRHGHGHGHGHGQGHALQHVHRPRGRAPAAGRRRP